MINLFFHFLFSFARMLSFKQWLILLVCSLAILKTEGLFVNITLVRNAVAKGAGELYIIILSFVKVCFSLCFIIFSSCFVFVFVFFSVCLDGSPPAYHLDRGSGTGINSWLIQLEVLFCFSLSCVLFVPAFTYSNIE